MPHELVHIISWALTPHEDNVSSIVEEAKRLGRVRWTCSGVDQDEAYRRLRLMGLGDLPHETMAQTQSRWVREHPPYK